MLPLATHCHTHNHLHPFYSVLFKYKVLVAKQHLTNTHTHTHTPHTRAHAHTHIPHTRAHTLCTFVQIQHSVFWSWNSLHRMFTHVYHMISPNRCMKPSWLPQTPIIRLTRPPTLMYEPCLSLTQENSSMY